MFQIRRDNNREDFLEQRTQFRNLAIKIKAINLLAFFFNPISQERVLRINTIKSQLDIFDHAKPLICLPSPSPCRLPPTLPSATATRLVEQILAASKNQQADLMLALFSRPAQLLTVVFALPCKRMWIKAGMVGRRLCGAPFQNQQRLQQCPGVFVVFLSLFFWEGGVGAKIMTKSSSPS